MGLILALLVVIVIVYIIVFSFFKVPLNYVKFK